MYYGINLATLGDYANPKRVVQMAQAAEASGWEAIFVWDHLAFAWGVPSGDPWIILAAVAQATKRIKIGSAVTPLPRRRPQVMANTLATLDLLSEGRVIFGVGLGGVPQEYEGFGEAADAKTRAEKLDEALEILKALFSGERVNYQGEHYRLNGVTLAPLPVQRPRPPIWIGGESRPALRRAAHWDGWVIGGDNEQGQMVKTPQQFADQMAYIRACRTTTQPFDAALTGVSSPLDRRLVREYGDAGMTWWLESLHGFRGDFDVLLARIKAGPPAD
jgi:probable F420-dependent oxidoreductase